MRSYLSGAYRLHWTLGRMLAESTNQIKTFDFSEHLVSKDIQVNPYPAEIQRRVRVSASLLWSSCIFMDTT